MIIFRTYQLKVGVFLCSHLKRPILIMISNRFLFKRRYDSFFCHIKSIYQKINSQILTHVRVNETGIKNTYWVIFNTLFDNWTLKRKNKSGKLWMHTFEGVNTLTGVTPWSCWKTSLPLQLEAYQIVIDVCPWLPKTVYTPPVFTYNYFLLVHILYSKTADRVVCEKKNEKRLSKR